jgi:tellurite resistance-related uncharacterized protein
MTLACVEQPRTDFRGHHYAMPSALYLVRSTPEFADQTVPAGLLRSHTVNADLWGRLTGSKGTLRFTFEEPELFTIELDAGGHVDIPPLIRHHLEPFSGTKFSVAFYSANPA